MVVGLVWKFDEKWPTSCDVLYEVDPVWKFMKRGLHKCWGFETSIRKSKLPSSGSLGGWSSLLVGVGKQDVGVGTLFQWVLENKRRS